MLTQPRFRFVSLLLTLCVWLSVSSGTLAQNQTPTTRVPKGSARTSSAMSASTTGSQQPGTRVPKNQKSQPGIASRPDQTTTSQRKRNP